MEGVPSSIFQKKVVYSLECRIASMYIHTISLTHVGYVNCMTPLSAWNYCYLLDISNHKQLNELMASFWMSGQICVQVHFLHALPNDLQQY